MPGPPTPAPEAPGSIRGWLGFGLGGLEAEFRAEVLPQDIVRARIAVASVAVGFLLVALTDLWLAEAIVETTSRVAGSAAFLMLSALVFRGLGSVKTPGALDGWLLGWQLTGVATVMAYRSADLPAMGGATIVLLVFGSYTVLPCRLLFRFLPAVLLTAGDMLIERLVLGVEPRVLLGSLLAYLFVHLAGISTAAGAQAVRRRQFTTRREDRRRREELEQRANTDGLTGVLRRNRWLELAEPELSRFLRHGRPFAVLIADLDYFKRINDAHGHLAGDEVLRQFAEMLRQQSRPFDLVGRIGGEEFGVLLPETDLVAAHEMADRIVRSCRELRVNLSGTEVGFTCSVGLTVAAGADRSITELLARADGAMYAAKVGGRDRVEVAVRPAPGKPVGQETA